MLYESNYNQYYLEHSWGPWKNHLYISRDGESGKFKYTYPKDYYDKYREQKGLLNYTMVGNKGAEADKEFESSYYSKNIDKVINGAVKTTVNALNFGLDLKGKAEGYLTRFGNAVANSWNNAKSFTSTQYNAGKQFVSNLWDSAKNVVTSKRISASVQNLMQGAAKAIGNSWGKAKNAAGTAANNIKNTASNTAQNVKNTVSNATENVKKKINKGG